MKKSLLLFLLLFLTVLINAQPDFHEEIFGRGNRPTIELGNSGNFIISYNWYDQGSFAELLVVSPTGDVVQNFVFENKELNAARQLNDGSFVLLIDEGNDLHFSSLSPDGELTELNSFAYNAKHKGVGRSLLPNTEDGYFLAYYIDGAMSDDDCALVKTDADGKVLNSNIFPFYAGAYDPHSFQLTEDGGLAFVATFYGSPPSRALVYQFNEDLELEWEQTYWDTTELEYPEHQLHSMVQTADKGFLLVGNWEPTGYYKNQAYFLKLDSLGQFEWSKKWDFPSKVTKLFAMAQNDFGEIYLAGTIANDSASWEKKLLLAKATALGDTIWTRQFSGLGFASPNSMVLDANGNPVVVGVTSDTTYKNHLFLIRPETPAVHTKEINALSNFEFQIAPNPVSGILNVTLTEMTEDKRLEITILDLEGRALKEFYRNSSDSNSQIQLDVSGLPAGSYFVEMIIGTEKAVQRFVKI